MEGEFLLPFRRVAEHASMAKATNGDYLGTLGDRLWIRNPATSSILVVPAAVATVEHLQDLLRVDEARTSQS